MTYQQHLGGVFITRQQFIIQTLTFIANSVFINIFAKLFGMSNSIVAVCIVVVALTLVAIDLKENLVIKTFYLSVVLLTLALAASFINVNPFLGLAINLVVIFFIVYEGCHTYKENMYFPFLLSYMFMGLSAPAKLDELPIRMIGIFIGCVYILIIQLVLNRGRFHKTVFHTKKQLLSVIQQETESVLNGTAGEITEKAIYPLTKPLVRALYDTRSKGKVLSSENKGKLLVILSLENIHKVLSMFSKKQLDQKEKECFNHLKALLEQLDNYFYGEEDQSVTKERILSLWQTLQAYQSDQQLGVVVDALKELPEALKHIGNSIPDLDKGTYSLRMFFKPIDRQTDTFKFAFKLSVCLSVIILLSDLCDLTYGRWIIFPLIAIAQPYMDGTRKKALERILGTVLGILLFVPIFALVKDNMVRLNITIFLAYINLFMKKYYISTALIAVSALGSVAMGGAGAEILILRIFFTALGCVIGLLINKYVFPKTLSQYTEELVKEYKDTTSLLEKSSDTSLEDTQKYDLILKNKLLEYEIARYT